MRGLTIALVLHALFGLECAYKAFFLGEWGESGCSFLVASSGAYLVLGMLWAVRRGGDQLERQRKAEKRRRVFRNLVRADHRTKTGAFSGAGTAVDPTDRIPSFGGNIP